MSTRIPTTAPEGIDKLMFGIGEPEDSARQVVPPIEADPLLSGLAQLAREMRQQQAVTRTTTMQQQNMQLRR